MSDTYKTLGDVYRAAEEKTEPGTPGRGFEAVSNTIVCHYKPLVKYINTNARNTRIKRDEEIVSMDNLLQWFPDQEIAQEGYNIIHWFYQRDKKRKGNRTMGTHPLIVGGKLYFLGASKKNVIGAKHHDDVEDLVDTPQEMDEFLRTGTLNGYTIPKNVRGIVENHTNIFSAIYKELTNRLKEQEETNLYTIEEAFEDMDRSFKSPKFKYGINKLRIEIFNAWYKSSKRNEEERAKEAINAFNGTIDRYKLYTNHFEWSPKEEWEVKGADADENSGDDKHLAGRESYMKVRRGNKSDDLSDIAIRNWNDLNDRTKFLFMSVLEKTANKFADERYVDLSSINPREHDIPKYIDMIKDIRLHMIEKTPFLLEYKEKEAESFLDTIIIPERPSIIRLRKSNSTPPIKPSIKKPQ